ncbi:MAG: HPF/RaiA family ribosome-associated protein [Candidatus Nealsonbacteria bacterium]|nr:HPF/RaiA family ribosome-associated protein [Candidatus Nealsonbacteria bacterium]
MRFSVSGDRIEITTDIREYIDRRLYFALGRFGTAIDNVSVRVGDTNGPRGGVDKHCQIVVKLRASGSHPIAVDDNDEDLYAAVARASSRAGRTVARAIERRRRKRTYQRRRMLAEDASRTMYADAQEDM